MFGTGHRVRANKMNAVGHMRDNGLKHGPFDRPHIRHDGTRFQVWGDRFGHGLHRADGDAQNHKVRVFDGVLGGVTNAINQIYVTGRCTCFRRTGIADDFTGQLAAPHRKRHGPRNQTKTNQRDTFKNNGHQRIPLNVAMT